MDYVVIDVFGLINKKYKVQSEQYFMFTLHLVLLSMIPYTSYSLIFNYYYFYINLLIIHHYFSD